MKRITILIAMVLLMFAFTASTGFSEESPPICSPDQNFITEFTGALNSHSPTALTLPSDQNLYNISTDLLTGGSEVISIDWRDDVYCSAIISTTIPATPARKNADNYPLKMPIFAGGTSIIFNGNSGHGRAVTDVWNT